MSRSDWDRHIEWKSAVLWNRQYNSAEDVKNKESSLGVSREMFIAEAGDDMIRVSMVPGAGKVTDSGYDQFACCAAEVPAGYDVRISAEIKAVISGGGNSNQEAWGIFIRDTLARDPETGYPYSNMALAGAFRGRADLFVREGIDAESIEQVYNHSLVPADSERAFSKFRDVPGKLRIELAKLGGCIRADIIDEDGNHLLRREEGSPDEFVSAEDGGVMMRISADTFLKREPSRFYIGFMAARGNDISIDTDTINVELILQEQSENGYIYASPDGSCSGNGSQSAPFDIRTAIRQDRDIFLLPGVYTLNEDLIIGKKISGTESSRRRMSSEAAVLDFCGRDASLILEADYWDIEGLTVTGGMGFQIRGSHNRIKHCTAHHNRETGILIRHRYNDGPVSEWPAFNLIEDCLSYCNRDISENNADGFACKVSAGEGNSFVRCRSYLNSDDGFDLFSKNRKTGAVSLTDCEAVMNGYKCGPDGYPVTTGGNGNGFKLGGSGISVRHRVKNCSAYDNRRYGFTSNSNPVMILENCSAADNVRGNYSFYFTGPAVTPEWIMTSCTEGDDAGYSRQHWLEEHPELNLKP